MKKDSFTYKQLCNSHENMHTFAMFKTFMLLYQSFLFFVVVADCGEPLVIERATVDQGTTLEGAVRRYTCSQNTITEGETTTTCLETGLWSATNLYCRREYNLPPPFPLSFRVLLDIHMHIKK